MKKLIINIAKNPLIVIEIIYFIIVILLDKLKGVKTIVFNIHYDHLFDIFKPVYNSLRECPNIKIYFSYNIANKGLKNYLLNYINNHFLIRNTVSPFVPFDMFICPEVTMSDFPVSYLNTKTVEITHEISTYNLHEKKNILNRFDVHFSIGPQFNDLIDDAHDRLDKPLIIYNTGFAKLDLLQKGDSVNDSLFIEYGIDKRPVILFAPHWNPHNSLCHFEEEIIKELSLFDAFILVKPHCLLIEKYKEINWKQRLCEISNKFSNVSIVFKRDIQELYPITDIMITDIGTSVSLEFSLLYKPLILYYNEEWFKGKIYVESERDICDTAFQFQELDELRNIISQIIKSDIQTISQLEEQRKKQNVIIKKYLFNPGCATERTVNAILNEISA